MVFGMMMLSLAERYYQVCRLLFLSFFFFVAIVCGVRLMEEADCARTRSVCGDRERNGICAIAGDGVDFFCQAPGTGTGDCDEWSSNW